MSVGFDVRGIRPLHPGETLTLSLSLALTLTLTLTIGRDACAEERGLTNPNPNPNPITNPNNCLRRVERSHLEGSLQLFEDEPATAPLLLGSNLNVSVRVG